MQLRRDFVLFFALLLGSPFTFAKPAPIENQMIWTGFYAGAGGGMGAWTGNAWMNVNASAVTAKQMQGGMGGFGTLMIGYDHQVNH